MKSQRRLLPYHHVMTPADFVHKNSLNMVTALLAGLAIWRLGLSPELPAVLAFIVGGVLLAVIDWRVQRLPSRIVYSTLAGVATGLVFASIVERDWVPLATAVAGGVLFANVFFLIWAITSKFVVCMLRASPGISVCENRCHEFITMGTMRRWTR